MGSEGNKKGMRDKGGGRRPACRQAGGRACLLLGSEKGQEIGVTEFT